MDSRATAIFANDRYATELSGITIADCGEHTSLCLMPLTASHCNARGVAMGGALYTLADFSAAVAANTDCLGEGDLGWVSLDATIHYLCPAPLGATMQAACSPLKTGRTTALYQTIITNPDNGKRIAIVETTMMRL